MVRLKTRWLLVRLDNSESLATAALGEYCDLDKEQQGNTIDSSFPVSKKDVYTAMQQHLSSTLGLSGDTIDLQGTPSQVAI